MMFRVSIEYAICDTKKQTLCNKNALHFIKYCTCHLHHRDCIGDVQSKLHFSNIFSSYEHRHRLRFAKKNKKLVRFEADNPSFHTCNHFKKIMSVSSMFHWETNRCNPFAAKFSIPGVHSKSA